MAGMDSLLDGMKVTKEKKNNGKEKIFLPCKKKMVDDLVGFKKKITDLLAKVGKIEYLFETGVRERRLQDAKKGNYLQSYYCQGSDQTIRVTCSDRFSKIAEEDVEDLKAFCTKNDIEFDTLFNTDESLVTKNFTKENLEKMLNSFKKTWGEEEGIKFFKNMFEYKKSVSTIKGFDEKQFSLDDDVRESITTQFTKQAKASVVTK